MAVKRHDITIAGWLFFSSHPVLGTVEWRSRVCVMMRVD